MELSNSEMLTEIVSPAEGDSYVNEDTIQASAELTLMIMSMINSDNNQVSSEVKQKCGRKPLFNFSGQKDQWEACVSDYIASQEKQMELDKETIKEGVKEWSTGAIVGATIGGVALLGLLGYVAYKVSKK